MDAFLTRVCEAGFFEFAGLLLFYGVLAPTLVYGVAAAVSEGFLSQFHAWRQICHWIDQRPRFFTTSRVHDITFLMVLSILLAILLALLWLFFGEPYPELKCARGNWSPLFTSAKLFALIAWLLAACAYVVGRLATAGPDSKVPQS
jgi:hypothetical protein